MSTDGDAAPPICEHRLSPQAIAYKARRKPSVPIRMPDLTDHAAVANWRAATNAMWGEDDNPAEPHRREVIGGIPCLAAGPSPGTDPPIAVYAHGGGYVLGSAAVAMPITARLAASGLRVVSVDYRQPPEFPFPAALDDVLSVYLALAAGDSPVALAGDSSGGALALSAAVIAAAEGVPPAAVALLSPLLDHVSVPGNRLADDEGRRLIDSYTGNANPADPRLSPLRAALGGLPPVLVQAATDEPLAAQAREFRRRAGAAGVAVTLDLWEGMWHTWQYHALPEADEALAEAAGFLAAAFSPADSR
ncbi:alpha/beta hydrolase [Candidatus Poriferisodalis sp.]|uniref:alpha/beta hydrolase n=1 Tax=Candidatus Poriferisodalis sp. TaxID=3101277 RepID=UPI003B02261D